MDFQRQNIILTGFMACGKTTVGKLLAQQLNLRFIDTDARIATEAEMSIAEIFSQKGENTFRELERKTATALAGQRGLVIATGGKMMLDDTNVTTLGKSGIIICLSASPEEILRRVTADGQHLRPLLAGSNPLEKISQLLAERNSGYKRFPEIPTDGKTPATIAEEIATKIKDGLFKEHQ